MDSKILKAIADSLPETQVKIIKDALIERDDLKEQNQNLEADKKSYSKYWTDERDKNSKLEAENAKLTEQNEKLITSNLELMAKDIENRVAVLQAELKGVDNTVDKFLKNTIYRESLQHQVVDEMGGTTTQYVNGQHVAVPYTSKTSKPVTDTKERTTE